MKKRIPFAILASSFLLFSCNTPKEELTIESSLEEESSSLESEPIETSAIDLISEEPSSESQEEGTSSAEPELSTATTSAVSKALANALHAAADQNSIRTALEGNVDLTVYKDNSSVDVSVQGINAEMNVALPQEAEEGQEEEGNRYGDMAMNLHADEIHVDSTIKTERTTTYADVYDAADSDLGVYLHDDTIYVDASDLNLDTGFVDDVLDFANLDQGSSLESFLDAIAGDSGKFSIDAGAIIDALAYASGLPFISDITEMLASSEEESSSETSLEGFDFDFNIRDILKGIKASSIKGWLELLKSNLNLLKDDSGTYYISLDTTYEALYFVVAVTSINSEYVFDMDLDTFEQVYPGLDESGHISISFDQYSFKSIDIDFATGYVAYDEEQSTGLFGLPTTEYTLKDKVFDIDIDLSLSFLEEAELEFPSFEDYTDLTATFTALQEELENLLEEESLSSEK